jgi:hypothetical protein
VPARCGVQIEWRVLLRPNQKGEMLRFPKAAEKLAGIGLRRWVLGMPHAGARSRHVRRSYPSKLIVRLLIEMLTGCKGENPRGGSGRESNQQPEYPVLTDQKAMHNVHSAGTYRTGTAGQGQEGTRSRCCATYLAV